MRNLTDEELKQIKHLSNELEEKSAELAFLVAKLRRECEAAPGEKINVATGEWKMEG